MRNEGKSQWQSFFTTIWENRLSPYQIGQKATITNPIVVIVSIQWLIDDGFWGQFWAKSRAHQSEVWFSSASNLHSNGQAIEKSNLFIDRLWEYAGCGFAPLVCFYPLHTLVPWYNNITRINAINRTLDRASKMFHIFWFSRRISYMYFYFSYWGFFSILTYCIKFWWS